MEETPRNFVPRRSDFQAIALGGERAVRVDILERLADEGDTLEVVGKLRNVVSNPQRVLPPNLSDTGSYVLDLEPRLAPDTNL